MKTINNTNITKTTTHQMTTGVNKNNRRKSSINDTKIKKITTINKTNLNLSTKKKTLYSMTLRKSINGYKPEKKTILASGKKHFNKTIYSKMHKAQWWTSAKSNKCPSWSTKSGKSCSLLMAIAAASWKKLRMLTY